MSGFKAGTWRKMLSYFTDIKLEALHSDISGYLEVFLSRGRVQLNTAHATYSFEDLYTSYGSALQHIKPAPSNIHSVLVMGLGLGSIPYFLQKKYDISCIINCVDIDPVIIGLANKYYPLPAGLNKLRIHQADAYDWIQKNQEKFDLITVDLFVDREVPKKLHKREFIEALKNSVSPGGTLLFSRLKSNEPIEYLLWENLLEVMKGGRDIESMGNAIYYWKNS